MSALKRSLDDGSVVDGTKKIKGEDGEAKTVDLMEIRVLIDNYEASVIIGKAGVNVKMVRTESTAFVSILKTDAQGCKERVMTVKGTEDAISKALQIICQLLIDSTNTRKAQQVDPATGVAPESETTYPLKILIHKFLAGSIIGNKGAIIKEIQEQSGARVQLSNEPLPGSTEKTVTVTGTPDTLYAAAVRVMTQLTGNPLRTGSSTILYVPGQSAVPFSPYGAAPPAPYGAPYGAPPQQQQQYPPPYGGAAPYGAPSPYGAPPVAAAGPSKTEKIVIPTVCAGIVIGKGGSIIRDIKLQSSTQITIADPEPTAPNDRVVAVTGTAQGISIAIYLVRQRVESYQPPTTTPQM